LLEALGLPAPLPQPVDAGQVVALCRVDKKVGGGAVGCVLIRGIGEPVRVADVAPSEIAAALDVIC
jgi:3-dehydroquinate synthetase